MNEVSIEKNLRFLKVISYFICDTYISDAITL